MKRWKNWHALLLSKNNLEKLTLRIEKSREPERKILEATSAIKTYGALYKTKMSRFHLISNANTNNIIKPDKDKLVDDLIVLSERIEHELRIHISPKTRRENMLAIKRQGSRWHAYLPTFEREFRKAMLTTNPKLIFGRTSDGPLVRFLTVVLPLITDEKVTQMAVAKKLKQTGGTLAGV